ncbi:DNA polymerase delta subunit 4-like [Diadema antillarum]|uniref:DNA polymerase delta subunit 4-like n=1 Tax=Diadema antillarum TaxID=105358 RepID=UPI003A87B75F
MTSKVTSQPLITDKFTQQKSASNSKTRGKKTPGRPIKSSDSKQQTAQRDEVVRADDLLRQEHLNKLREFDLDWRFGPCTGITRLERWERAERHGYNPPKNIKDLVLEHKDDEEYVQNIWTGYPI